MIISCVTGAHNSNPFRVQYIIFRQCLIALVYITNVEVVSVMPMLYYTVVM